MDLSALSSKLLPGFTALGFREERRSRGERPRGPGSPCGRRVRAWFGTSSYRSGPGKCWESGAHRAGGQVPPLPLGGRGLHSAAACVCGLRFLQQAVTLHPLEGSRDCLQRGPCAKGGRTRGAHAGLSGLCGSCVTSPSSEDAAWARRRRRRACARSPDAAPPRPPSHLPVRGQHRPVHAQQLSVRRLEVRRGGAAVLGLRRRDGCAVRAEVGGGAALAGRAGGRVVSSRPPRPPQAALKLGSLAWLGFGGDDGPGRSHGSPCVGRPCAVRESRGRGCPKEGLVAA